MPPCGLQRCNAGCFCKFVHTLGNLFATKVFVDTTCSTNHPLKCVKLKSQNVFQVSNTRGLKLHWDRAPKRCRRKQQLVKKRKTSLASNFTSSDAFISNLDLLWQRYDKILIFLIFNFIKILPTFVLLCHQQCKQDCTDCGNIDTCVQMEAVQKQEVQKLTALSHYCIGLNRLEWHCLHESHLLPVGALCTFKSVGEPDQVLCTLLYNVLCSICAHVFPLQGALHCVCASWWALSSAQCTWPMHISLARHSKMKCALYIQLPE